MYDVSIIIPTLNEETVLPLSLKRVQTFREQNVEIIVVDGGSTDNTVHCTDVLVDKLVTSPAGRALQLNKGAKVARGKVFVFLHADSVLPKDAVQIIKHEAANPHSIWGRFNVKLDGQSFMFRVIENLMNWRSCLTGIATGDQSIFVSKELFEQINGYPEIELMEDIEISKKLKQIKRPICIKSPVVTSSRRWEEKGIVKTILLMWSLRLAYFFKIPASTLAKKYH